MISVPIIFAIDDNVVVPCGVTITSLLRNASPDTLYNIFILCEEDKLPEESRNKLLAAFSSEINCHIEFVDVGDSYSDVPEMQRITKATYYRLLIPTLFPQFDRAIYSDIDIIFQRDLSELYEKSFPNNELIAATLDLAIDEKYFFRSDLPSKIGKSVTDYFNAGFLLMNLKQLREENKVEEFNKHAKKKYPQNDQDVLNIVCNGRVQWLPSIYNFQTNHYANYMWGRSRSEIDFSGYLQHANFHYTWRNKPWCSLESPMSDAWWHYYRMSPMFDNSFYFKQQYKTIEAVRSDYHSKDSKTLMRHLLARLKHKIIK